MYINKHISYLIYTSIVTNFMNFKVIQFYLVGYGVGLIYIRMQVRMLFEALI